MGLGGTFTKLVKGLLTRVVSKVHINGRFTEEIPITRGMRQGCPLSPLIFALSTQPLMGYLQHKITTREMEGVKISDELTICHRNFANDVGVFIPTDECNFQKLQEAQRIYELAFEAKLNLAKSVIIPLAMTSVPQWFQDTGCTISQPGKVQKYLGVPFGHHIKPTDMYKFFLNCISKQIFGWANSLLNFREKVPLIQHVLHSITTYHMMYSSALVIVLQ